MNTTNLKEISAEEAKLLHKKQIPYIIYAKSAFDIEGFVTFSTFRPVRDWVYKEGKSFRKIYNSVKREHLTNNIKFYVRKEEKEYV